MRLTKFGIIVLIIIILSISTLAYFPKLETIYNEYLQEYQYLTDSNQSGYNWTFGNLDVEGDINTTNISAECFITDEGTSICSTDDILNIASGLHDQDLNTTDGVNHTSAFLQDNVTVPTIFSPYKNQSKIEFETDGSVWITFEK